MSSILFEIGREIVDEVQAGIKAHNDVKEGKPVERREDKWGDPMAPKTVYSIVRGVEEQLGMGKDKGKGKPTTDGEDGMGVKDDQAVKEDQWPDASPANEPIAISSGSSSTAAVVAHDPNLRLVSDAKACIPSPPPYASATNGDAGYHTAPVEADEKHYVQEPPNEGTETAGDHASTSKGTRADRIHLDALGVPVPRESGVATEHRPPPPPPPTRADKIYKGLETADEVAADIALGVLIGNVLDGPTQTLVEGLMSIDNEETPQSKKARDVPNRDALKAARKEIDKQTPKREALAKKLAGYEQKLDEPAGGRSEKEVEKDHKRLEEKMNEVKKDLAKVDGKLERAEYDVAKYKPRVEEFERLTIEKRAKKLRDKQEKEAAKRVLAEKTS